VLKCQALRTVMTNYVTPAPSSFLPFPFRGVG
jgi:hypothetical protein